MIRPHFTTFIKTMKEQMPNSYFYVYTASEKKWAEIQIKLIEKNLNIKFDRPIFTRNDCNPIVENNKLSFTKSIERIKKKIKVPNPEIIIIDDKKVYIDNSHRLINCRVYNYKSFCNYWDYIPIDNINNKVFLKFLTSLMEQSRLSPVYQTTTTKQKCDYYKWLYLKTSEINKSNKKYKKDKFWLSLTKIINDNRIREINDKSVSLIQHSF